MQLAELKQQFLKHLLKDKGRSEKTLENYNRYLNRFFKFSKIKRPREITEEQVKSFVTHLKRQSGAKVNGRVKPMKPRTQNYYLIAIRMFLKYLGERGYKTLSPETIKLTKLPNQLPSQISTDELTLLLNAPDCRTLEGKRDKVILSLLSSTGIHVSELCTLNITDAGFTEGEIFIRGKTGKDRTILLSTSTQRLLKDYLKNRQDTHVPMFVRYGRKMNDGGDPRLSPRAVQRLIKKYATESGIIKPVTPNIVRYSSTANLGIV